MRKQLRKIISILLITIALLSSLSVSSFSATNLINDNLTTSGWSWWSDPYTFTTNPALYYNSSTTASRITIPANPDGSYAMRYTSIPANSVYPNDTYTLSFDVYGDFSKCRLGIAVKLNGNSTANGGYLVTIYENFNTGNNIYTHGQVNFVPSNMASNVDRIELELWFLPADYSSQVQLYIKNLSLVDATDDSGMWSRLWTWLQDIYNRIVQVTSQIGNLGSNLSNWFSNLWTNLKAYLFGGTDSSGVNHTGLTGAIGGFFTNLWNNLSTAFSNLTSSIGQFFVNLGDDIESFFVALKNYLLYFHNPVTIVNGIPYDENGNPLYENIFDIPDFFDTLEDWVDDLDNAKTDVETGASDGVQAFEDTIAPLSTILSRVSFLTVFVTFALAIVVIKKVIG